MEKSEFKKYLYGKKANLLGLLEGKNGLRFSHIRYYSEMENKNMKDDETQRMVNVDTDKLLIDITFNGKKNRIQPSNLNISKKTCECYCLCFSNKKNNEELYSKFNADICIEFDIQLLEQKIQYLINQKFDNFILKSNNITYYSNDEYQDILEKNSEELIFYKSNSYSHEDEYRIALLYPIKKNGFTDNHGNLIPFPQHFYLNSSPAEYILESIKNVFYYDL